MIGSTNAGGGIGGGTITVTAEGSATATVSNELTGRRMSKPVSSGQPAVFKNLTAGDWLVTVDNGTEPVTETVSIVLDHTVQASFFTAYIVIAYPAGSVCSATMGSYSFTAPDTSGEWTLAVPVMGTWHVSCTDGEDIAEADVNITTDGQLEELSLVYTLVLYSPGDEHATVTGGWARYSAASVTKGASYLRVVPSTQYSSGYAGTVNAIDLTDVKTLYVDGHNNCAQGDYLIVGVTASKGGSFKAKASFSANQRAEKAINVASLSGLYYVQAEVYWGDYVKGDGRIYNVRGVK